MKLKDIVMQYLENIKYSIKQKTYLFYLQMNEIYVVGFNKEISLSNLNEFIVSIKEKYSYSTTKLVKSLINRSLNLAFENGLTKEKIVITLHLKNQQIRKVQALEKQEQAKLENYILENNKIYYFGILLSLYTGLRLGEVLALKWQNIDIKNKLIYVDKSVGTISQNHKTLTIESSPKTQSSIREIPISKKLLDLIKVLRQNPKSDYVIVSHNGKQIQSRAYQKSFENLLKKLHIKHYGFHSLRHTFATRLLENKVDIKTISELLGHSNPSITLNRYVHTNIENKRRAMQKIKFAV
ncbi:MAG TPA: hypothetical protein DCZ34_00405 [Clostridiales bacterium]|nr:hypothetical protein [Clostridiales bacterium]